MKKLFHIEISGSHKYYGSLTALMKDNLAIGVSKGKLDRFNFSQPFENDICTIRKSVVKTSGEV